MHGRPTTWTSFSMTCDVCRRCGASVCGQCTRAMQLRHCGRARRVKSAHPAREECTRKCTGIGMQGFAIVWLVGLVSRAYFIREGRSLPLLFGTGIYRGSVVRHSRQCVCTVCAVCAVWRVVRLVTRCALPLCVCSL